MSNTMMNENYDYFIQWIEDIESIHEDDRKRLYELRNHNRNRNKHLSWIEKNEERIEKELQELKRRKQMVRKWEMKEKEVFDEILFLKKVIIPTLTIYKKDDSPKSVKDLNMRHYKRKTYKGKPLKRRFVWYCQVRVKTLSHNLYQRSIYLGSTEKIVKVLNWYKDEDKKTRSDNQIKIQMTHLLLEFLQPLLMDGWDNFEFQDIKFDKVILPYLGKKKGTLFSD